MLEFVSSPIVRVPNCPALGCFLQDDFRFYWGTSSMFMGSCVIILTTTILVKLRRVEKRLRVAKIFLGKESSGFKQGNRISLGILIISLLFVTLPSVAAGFFRIAGFSFFKTVGLFYIVGLLCAGTCNSLAYLSLNSEMREFAKRLRREVELRLRGARISIVNFALK
ncbi:unnamed protein product [Strongylus vulgaris]|uniref:Uncharacterized protein n=1 Tax=Strongylus vulgaris TaxID=40348 RepID=A0A3P7L8H8_STRVU|nr:unnamed protein product [Strongylus vulgaris]